METPVFQKTETNFFISLLKSLHRLCYAFGSHVLMAGIFSLILLFATANPLLINPSANQRNIPALT
jgi:hypothetical protein